jgi:hypothetical protein
MAREIASTWGFLVEFDQVSLLAEGAAAALEAHILAS